MLSVIYAECHLCWVSCWVSFMLSVIYAEWHLCCVIYAECHLCWVSFMLSVIIVYCLRWVPCLLKVFYSECHLCWMLPMLKAIYAWCLLYVECHLWWALFMLSVTSAEYHSFNFSFILNTIYAVGLYDELFMLNVAYAECHFCYYSLCWVSRLGLFLKWLCWSSLMLIVIDAECPIKPTRMNCIMLNVVVLNVVVPCRKTIAGVNTIKLFTVVTYNHRII